MENCSLTCNRSTLSRCFNIIFTQFWLVFSPSFGAILAQLSEYFCTTLEHKSFFTVLAKFLHHFYIFLHQIHYVLEWGKGSNGNAKLLHFFAVVFSELTLSCNVLQVKIFSHENRNSVSTKYQNDIKSYHSSESTENRARLDSSPVVQN